jgi:hypothetical protein
VNGLTDRPAAPDLDAQRRMARRALAQGRRWILRGVLFGVIAVTGLVRGGGLMITISVVCWVLAILSVSLGRRTRLQAREIERKIALMGRSAG